MATASLLLCSDAGATGATATYLASEPSTRAQLKLYCKTGDLATTTAIEYCVRYKVL